MEVKGSLKLCYLNIKVNWLKFNVKMSLFPALHFPCFARNLHIVQRIAQPRTL